MTKETKKRARARIAQLLTLALRTDSRGEADAAKRIAKAIAEKYGLRVRFAA